MNEFESFITGSHAYGKPGPDSDVDLVVYCEYDTCQILKRGSEHTDKIAYGNLNIIPLIVPDEYKLWKKGTEYLVEKSRSLGRPMTRDEAIEVFNDLGVTGGSG